MAYPWRKNKNASVTQQNAVRIPADGLAKELRVSVYWLRVETPKLPAANVLREALSWRGFG
jgi:hypothetical protein